MESQWDKLPRLRWLPTPVPEESVNDDDSRATASKVRFGSGWGEGRRPRRRSRSKGSLLHHNILGPLPHRGLQGTSIPGPRA